jgi:hypothetical protein
MLRSSMAAAAHDYTALPSLTQEQLQLDSVRAVLLLPQFEFFFLFFDGILFGGLASSAWASYVQSFYYETANLCKRPGYCLCASVFKKADDDGGGGRRRWPRDRGQGTKWWRRAAVGVGAKRSPPRGRGAWRAGLLTTALSRAQAQRSVGPRAEAGHRKGRASATLMCLADDGNGKGSCRKRLADMSGAEDLHRDTAVEEPKR